MKQREKEYVRIVRAKLSESFSKDLKHFWQAIKDLKNDNVNEVNPLSAIDNSTLGMTTFQDYILQVITLKQVILNLTLNLIQIASLVQSLMFYLIGLLQLRK